jgi:ATP-dependent helicase/nuclease subunit A
MSRKKKVASGLETPLLSGLDEPVLAAVEGVRDAAARQRIVTELDRNLLVEAGAGSGKTQKLAERMAAGIATGRYVLEGLAAVTFTRKAAAELRGRFQQALEHELQQSTASDRQDRIRAALSNLERFFAGTIHSFCARLLRERPVEAGVSPGFTELDDVEERLVRQQSWRDYRAQAKAIGDVDLLELLDAGITAKQLDKAFETVCLYEDVTFPTGDATMPDATQAWKAIEKFWGELAGLLPSTIEPASTCKTQERAGRFTRQWRAYQRGNRDAALLVELMRCWESKPAVVQRWWGNKASAKQAEQLHEDFRTATVLPYLTAWRQHLYGRCIALLTRAREAAQADRRLRNALSFNDLLLMTAQVLRENADVRRALQQKYRWLLVDEFQDTDPVQAEIMFLLAQDDDAPGADGSGSSRSPKPVAGSLPAPSVGRSPSPVVTLRPGALFVVGDPKQSIFRFRRADIDIYNEVRARLGGPDGSGIVRLTTNFRSVPGLCEWANDVFRARFPAAPTPHAPMFASLDPYREATDHAPAIAVLDLEATLDPRDLPVEEGARIARYIRAEVDAGRREFGDFLILTRRKKGLRPCAQALEDLQVPMEVTGAGAFDQSEEVREIALLLTALADPQDAVALVGVLRGSLFGLSDRDLFAFKQAGGYFNFFTEMTSSEPSAGRVAVALASLRLWFKWTRMLPAGAALERILDDSGYLALAATSHGGVEAGDLLHAIDRVRAVVESGSTLAEAADALAGWSGLDDDGPDESTEVDSLPLEPGRRDVVRLMNLHKAKGLEAKVVFLADPLGGFEPRVDVRVVRDGGNAVGYFKIVEEKEGSWVRTVLAEPAGWTAHEADEKAYLTAEVDRLLYVAATRAKDTLVVSRYAGGAGRRTPAWEVLSAKMASAPALVIPATVTLPPFGQVDLSAAAVAMAMTAAAGSHQLVRQPSWTTTSVTAESKRLPRFVLESPDVLDDADPTRTVIPDTPSHRADAGMAWGALVHGLLEHAMRHQSATRDDLTRLAMWLTVEEPQLRAVIGQAVDTVLAVVRSPELAAARAAVECHEEVPFAVRETGTGLPAVITGVIDLAYRGEDGWHALDYKTDADAKDADLAERHKRQLEAYERTWGRVSGMATRARILSARA